MGNKKWTRVLALVMALVCTLTVVAAVEFDALDVNQDGKVTVWDLQKWLGKDKYNDALKQVLGGKGDELNTNSEGAYEIWSEMGWKHFVKNADKGLSFKLMTDIDLKGADWTPLVFTGNFDGDGNTIKNVNITKSVNLSSTNECRMGFFAGIQDGSEVVNLNLENVNLIIDAQDQAAGAGNITRYAGLLAGHNRGTVKNCTATGSVTDNRTELSKDVYIGALVGQNQALGTLQKGTGNLLTATAGTGKADDKVEGVSAKLATFYAEATGGTRTTGIAGFSATNLKSENMIWQDTTSSTANAPQAEQERRNTVVAEMYKMGTVEWTPSQTVTFTRKDNKTHNHSNAFETGRTYVGLPYVGARDGNYDRFLSQMQTTKDDQGRYVTVDGLTDGTQSSTYEYDGFVTMMGNSCHWAVIWSWSKVSPHRVQDGYGGIAVNELGHMIPTAENLEERGALAVGDYVVADGTTDTHSIVTTGNTLETMAESYAKARKGDAIVSKAPSTVVDGKTVEGEGHTRMLSQDPVIIRDYLGDIDLDKSYIQFHGQGDGLSDKLQVNGQEYITADGYKVALTSWRLNHKVSLSALLTEDGRQEAADAGLKPGGYWGYIPVTMNAFTAEDSFETTKMPYYNPKGEGITLPNTGSYYSNYKNVSATMVIKNANDVEVYNKTAYMMKTTVTPNVFYDPLDLSELFPDVQLAAGEYTATLSFKAANGVTTVVKDNESFTVS